VTNLLGLVSTIVLARLLTPDDFGIVALGAALLSILSSFTDMPVSDALIQHREPTPEHFNTAWTISAVRSALVSLIFAGAAWPLSKLYDDPRLVGVILALSLSALLGGLGNPRAIMLTKELVFWQQAMLQVVQKLSGLIVAIALALAYRSYWAILVGTLAGQLSGVIVSYTVMPFRPKLGFKHGRQLLSFSIWLTLGQVVNTINWRLDQLIIGSMLGKGVLGYYAVGENVATIPTREVTASLASTLFPAFSQFAGQKSRLASAYQSAQTVITALALPVGVGMALIADPLVRLTMGEKWLPSVFIIQALSSVFAFQTFGSLAQPLAMATGETRLLFKRDWQALILRVPLLLVGAYLWGLHGIVYARVFVGSAGVFLSTNVVTRVTGLSFTQQVRVNVRSFSSTVLMAAAVAGTSLMFPATVAYLNIFLKLFTMIAVGTLTYVSSSVVLWVLMNRPKGPESELLAVLGHARELWGDWRANPGASDRL
jgi:PST family polysaccharide transporter